MVVVPVGCGNHLLLCFRMPRKVRPTLGQYDERCCACGDKERVEPDTLSIIILSRMLTLDAFTVRIAYRDDHRSEDLVYPKKARL